MDRFSSWFVTCWSVKTKSFPKHLILLENTIISYLSHSWFHEFNITRTSFTLCFLEYLLLIHFYLLCSILEKQNEKYEFSYFSFLPRCPAHAVSLLIHPTRCFLSDYSEGTLKQTPKVSIPLEHCTIQISPYRSIWQWHTYIWYCLRDYGLRRTATSFSCLHCYEGRLATHAATKVEGLLTPLRRSEGYEFEMATQKHGPATHTNWYWHVGYRKVFLILEVP